MNTEFIGLIISMLLTIMVFSYILGDNPLFKVAEHIFVGVSVGYAVLVAWHQVLVPTFFDGRTDVGSLLSKLPPALLCFLLIFKIAPTQTGLGSALGSIALAFLIGVGSALAIGGALFGTLAPQTMASINLNLNPASPEFADAPYNLFFLDDVFLSNVVVLIGTVGTLFYFTFTHKPQGPLSNFREWFVNFFAGMGRWVILITLGALFGNIVSSRVAIFVSRLQFFGRWLSNPVGTIAFNTYAPSHQLFSRRLRHGNDQSFVNCPTRPAISMSGSRPCPKHAHYALARRKFGCM